MTKKKICRSFLVCALAAIVACAMVFVPQNTFAGGAINTAKFAKKMTVSTSSGMVMISMGKKLNGAQSVTIKSSNKKVAYATPYSKGDKYIYVGIEKKGTTKLTVKVKKKSGTKTYKGKLKVVAYKNPAKKITLNGKNITSKFKKTNYYESTARAGNKTPLTIKAKKGWKVKEIRHISYGTAKTIAKTKKKSTVIY